MPQSTAGLIIIIVRIITRNEHIRGNFPFLLKLTKIKEKKKNIVSVGHAISIYIILS